MTGTEFFLTPDLFPLLSSLAGTDSRELSPWKKGERVESLNEAHRAKLQAAQLCDESGQLKKDVAYVVEKLKSPSRMIRLRLMTGPSVMEHLIYFFEPMSKAVSISSTGDKLLVRAPAPLRQLVESFSEYWGYSSLVSSGFKLQLDPASALTLGALADLHRRQALADRAAMTPPEKPFFTLAQVFQAINQTPRDGQWLVTTIKSFTNLRDAPSEEAVARRLDALAGPDTLSQEKGSFSLEGQGRAFFNNFLLISQVLRLEVFTQEDDGQVSRSAMLCLQAGLHDNLYLENQEDKVVLEAVSSRLMVDILETLSSPGSGVGDTLPKE